MLSRRIGVCIFTAFFFLSACNAPVYKQTEGNIGDVAKRVKEATKISNESGKAAPSLVVSQDPYVDSTPISLTKQPSWLKDHVILKGDKLPFSYYSRTLVGGGSRSVLTRYQVGLNESVPLSITYEGTIKGALDVLAAKSGYVYSINGNAIFWQAFITKTFDIAFMPGSSDYMMGKSGNAGGGAAASAGGSGAGQTVSAIIDDSASSQYSSLKGTMSIWKDLETTIRQLLSPNGTVVVAESTTSVTVRDRPTNIDLIAKYVANLNNNLSKQVLVKVQVLDISLSNSFNYGINWTAVKNTLNGTQFSLNANYGTPISISTLGAFATTTLPDGSSGLPQMGFNSLGSSSTGVSALISALTQQGKVSLVTEPRVVCLNNQVSVIRIVQQAGYLASVQTTSLAGSGSSSTGTVTSQVTPGQVTTGLTLYILPKIMNHKVFLQVNADLSVNNGIQTISSSSGGSPTSSNTAPVIQVPSLTQKQFNQRSVVKSGDTLILSGFRQVGNTANAMQLYQSQSLGGKASVQASSETVVLITPIILNGMV